MSENYAFTHNTGRNLVVGNRESFGDTVWNIAQDETPMLSKFPREGGYDSTERKWYFEKLEIRDARNSVARVQGGEPNESTVPRYEGMNYNMIFEKSVFISRTMQKQLKSGVTDEMAHQTMIKMINLKQSVEQAIACRVRKRAPVEGTTAGLFSGIPGNIGRYGDTIMHVNGVAPVYGVNNFINVEDGYGSFSETAYPGVFNAFKLMGRRLAQLGSQPKYCFLGYEDKEFVSRTWDISTIDRQMSAEKDALREKVSVVMTDFQNIIFVPVNCFNKFGGDLATEDYDGGTAGRLTMVTDFAILGDPALAKVQVFDDFFAEPYEDTRDGIKRRCLYEGSFELSVPHAWGVFDFGGYTGHTAYTGGLPTTAGAYTIT